MTQEMSQNAAFQRVSNFMTFSQYLITSLPAQHRVLNTECACLEVGNFRLVTSLHCAKYCHNSQEVKANLKRGLNL